MLSWLASNLGTILISLLLALLVTGIVIKLKRDKKKGVSSCGGNCAHCAMNGSCGNKP